SIIPVIGSWLVWIPVSLTMIFTGNVTGGIVLFLYGLLFVSTIDNLGIIGGILIIISVAIISMDDRRWKFREVIPYVLMNIIPWSISITIDDILISDFGITPMFWMVFSYFLPGVIMSIFLFRHLKNVRKMLQDRKNKIFILITTFSSFVAYLLIYSSYNYGVNATQANFILSTQVIVSVLIGIIFLREKKNIAKVMVAAVLSSVGVWLLT
ncbi:MAG: EamA family transporter, partial [bacterium]